ncbi:response regulator [Limisalsivibrio acetivorans]|uniref:response regulator n=1 Tax=Limisalsivibrio acetivorans TaxID=1304888 RepID=UPI0003B5F7D8|nr:response regulator [Limisalsivibrio acetivorans]
MDKRILLVEDNRDEREGLAKLLEGSGFSVETAENGLFALDKLKEEEFDLVVTDLMMPAADGLQFLHTIRSAGDEMPVIVITGNENIASMLSAFQMGALDVVYKPFNYDTLLETISGVLS